MTESKNYIENGITYNMENIWNYMNEDYWDADDLKFDFDFWFRMRKHTRIFYEVMRLNNVNINEDDGKKDYTNELLEEMDEKNKNYKIEIIWED